MDTPIYGEGDRVAARLPGDVNVAGPITAEPIRDEQDGVLYLVEQAAGGRDDGHHYVVRQDEITTVLDIAP